MMDTAMNNYGAFILVDHAYVPLKILAQQTDNDQSTPSSGPSNSSTDDTQINSTNDTQPAAAAATRQTSPPPSSSAEPTNTNAPEPLNTENGTASPEPTVTGTTDVVASKSEVTPAGTNSDPKPEPPKVASVESDEEEGVASG
ncbi:hypothetical protein IL306_004993 [Fusarium sp. DS 682]|nr:hypothetical protein IL306_004993 [Fusarium sp. DS 682]